MFNALRIVLLLLAPVASVHAAEAALWQALRGGNHVALIRHADAPGTGDPAEFRIGDCTSQRNLGEKGRMQAARIGERFRANGIAEARVLSSQWCRARDTATLMKVGAVTELPVLNSFFSAPEKESAQIRDLRRWIAAQDLTRPVVLVTHQVNITGLTGVYPASGEIVIVRREPNGALSVAGRIPTG